MAQRTRTGHQRLFEIQLLHHYWLDEGQTVFDLISEQGKREARLLNYDIRSALSLIPTRPTAQVLNGLGGIFKATALGCVVAMPNGVAIPSDSFFEFIITVRSQAFFDYIALTLRPQKIHELYHATEKRLYRYKENLPVLSNATGISREMTTGKVLSLSTEIPTGSADDRVEALVRSGNVLLQLTGDQPDAGVQQLGAEADKWPVFVHQGDVPAIVPPAKLAGVPKQGISLSADVPDDVFALIQLRTRGVASEDFNLIEQGGQTKAPHPVFHVRLKNRSTRWRYWDRKARMLKATEDHPLPLTYFGNAGTKQKPPAESVRPVTSGGKVVQLISDIFV